MSDLYRGTIRPSNRSYDDRALTMQEAIDDGALVPVEPAGTLDVHENGVKAINCDPPPGTYLLVKVDDDG